MKVLMDAYWWVSGPPSGRNVVRTVVATWATRHPDDELSIVVRPDDAAEVRSALASEGLDIQVLTYPRWAKIHAVAVATLRASRRHFHAVLTHNFTPVLSTCARGVVVYDALFVAHPSWFKRTERIYLHLIRPLLARAQVIFTISRAENDRISTLWPETRGKCVPVGLGVPAALAKASPAEPTLPMPQDQPFILSVGRLNVRKNLARLIEAFDVFSADDPTFHLLIVGQPDGAVEDLGLPLRSADRIHFLGFVDDANLRWLYEQTALFACPSLDEGLGLPVLEASSLGAKVVASDVPVFRELGLAVSYFDPRSIQDIARALAVGVAATSPRTSEMPYTWEQTVDGMRQHLERIANRLPTGEPDVAA